MVDAVQDYWVIVTGIVVLVVAVAVWLAAGRWLAGIVTERDLLRALIRQSPARTPIVEPFLW